MIEISRVCALFLNNINFVIIIFLLYWSIYSNALSWRARHENGRNSCQWSCLTDMDGIWRFMGSTSTINPSLLQNPKSVFQYDKLQCKTIPPTYEYPKLFPGRVLPPLVFGLCKCFIFSIIMGSGENISDGLILSRPLPPWIRPWKGSGCNDNVMG